ncbi:MAG: hypothetical protein WD009_00550 [Phycisphaeraceae bacterium]
MPATCGDHHARIAREVRELLRQTKPLLTDPVLLELLACQAVGEAVQRASSSPADGLAHLNRRDAHRARQGQCLHAFLTTTFFTAEAFTGLPGQSTPLGATLRGAEGILGGDLKQVSAENLRYVNDASASA